MTQYNVTGITTGSVVDEADSIINGVTYLNQTLPVTSVTAGTQTWVVGGLNNTTLSLRRSGGGNAPDRQVVYGERETLDNPNIVRIPEPTTTQALLNANNLYGGTDNLFVNSAQSAGNMSDVERVDFVAQSGVTANATTAVGVFERGTNNSHDGFQIAAITGVDGSGTPTAFGDLKTIAAGWGTTPLRSVANPGYTVVNNSSGSFSNTANITSQNIGGVVITLDQLVTAGTTVYGYALFGADVTTGGDPNNLVDVTNNTYYPQNSGETVTQGGNGIDLSTINLGIITAPDAVNNSYTTPEDTALIIPASGVLGNDTDPEGDTLTVTAFTQPANGTVTIGSDGQLLYTPNANFNGVETLNYTISDGNGGTDTATVTITVTGVNDAPDAVDNSYTTDEDTPLTINANGVLGNDTDPEGDTLTVTAFTQPAHGTVTIDTDGKLQYTPNPKFNGVDTLNYTISDGNGGTDTATVTITVTGVNDAPDAVDNTYTTDEDTPLTIAANGVLGNDTDPEGDTLTVTAFTQPTNGTVTIGSDGKLEYTPNANFNGVDTLNYTISDGNGGTDTATVTINVTGVNDAPDAVDNSYTTDEDTPLTIAANGVLGNDTDPDGDTLTVTAFTQPTNGTVTIGSDGKLEYTPNANFHGVDTLNYTISDGNGGTDTATVTITVTGVNDAPDAVDNSYTTDEDTKLTINANGVLGNDTDPEGDTLTVTAFTQPTNGTVTIGSDGKLEYTPNANFNGVDTLNYTISDGNGGTDTATVTINVTGVNDLPTPVSDSYSTRVNRPMTQSPTGVVYNVLSNDTDVDGDTLTVTRTQQPTNGTVVLNADGTIKYTPNVNFTGLDSFRYTVSDGNGGTARATVTVNVSSGPSLDVVPGQNPSNVDLTSGGTLSVGLLSTATSNTTQVLPSSIRLDDDRDALMSGGGVAPVNRVRSDVNGDGRADLLLTFNMSDVASVVGAGQNIFVYGTNNGTQLIAANPNSDSVIVTDS